jgi:hypothetical protein
VDEEMTSKWKKCKVRIHTPTKFKRRYAESIERELAEPKPKMQNFEQI